MGVVRVESASNAVARVNPDFLRKNTESIKRRRSGFGKLDCRSSQRARLPNLLVACRAALTWLVSISYDP